MNLSFIVELYLNHPTVSSLLQVHDLVFSPSGGVTDLNVWSRVLQDDEMAAVTGCEERPQGDVLDWDKAEFELGEDTSLVRMLCHC